MTREEATERIEFLRDHACNYYIGRENGVALEIALEVLKLPEQKKGKWIEKGRKSYCSECGEVNFLKPNFCPNCGAEMEGEE